MANKKMNGGMNGKMMMDGPQLCGMKGKMVVPKGMSPINAGRQLAQRMKKKPKLG